MAGDIGLDERVIILPPNEEGMDARAVRAVEASDGRVLHQYGPRVLIVEASPEAEEAIGQELPEAAMGADSAVLPAADTTDLDALGAMGLAAFAMRQSQAFLEAKAERPRDGEHWDTPDTVPPDLTDEEGALPDAGAPSPPTSARLIGKVAVGIIIVEGPTPNLQFSAAERTKIAAEVQNGLSWLAGACVGAGLTWHYDIQDVSISVQPGSQPDEALWRNATMQAMGFQANWNGVYDYINSLRTQLNTDQTYCAFFTKYPLSHFAYATIGGPRLVMEYANDGWGPDNIDRVFTHETGHIFQAPDEYASACTCDNTPWGYFQVPNRNCANCPSSVDCVMKANTFNMCNYTPYHFGLPWPNSQRINQVDSTGSAPATCAFNNRLYIVFQSNDSSNRILFTASSDGKTWPNSQRINQVDSTGSAPAVCIFNNRLYIVFQSNDSSNRILFTSSTDGQTWPASQRINQVDSTGSALATCVFNNRLYIVFQSNDSSNRILFTSSTDGQTWSNSQRINQVDSTGSAPAVCVFNNRLYIIFQSNDSSNRILFTASADGQTWPASQRINQVDTTSAGPAALVYNNSLYTFFKANDSSNTLRFTASSGGTTWPVSTNINNVDSTGNTPAACIFQTNPYLLFQSNDSSNRILYSP